MRITIALILIVKLHTPVFSQLLGGYELGDSYNTTLDKISKDPLSKYYSVAKSKNRIFVSIISGSGIDESSTNIYDFEKNSLKRMYLVLSTNPVGTWHFLYQQHVKNDGEPSTITVDDLKLTYWDSPIGRTYYYLAYSNWFHEECLYVLITKEKFEKLNKRELHILKN